MLELSNEYEVTDALKSLPLWVRENEKIQREFSASDFASAIGFVNAVAILAEKLDHHPDILIYGWNKVRITLSTHSSGGLTALDFNLAKRIEALNFF